jgi:hypothetical protein
MGGLFDPRVFSAETHHVGEKADPEAKEREARGAGEAGRGGAGRGAARRLKSPYLGKSRHRKLVSGEEQTMKLTDWGESARSTSWPLWPVIALTIGVAGLLLWILMMGRAIWNLLGLGIPW